MRPVVPLGRQVEWYYRPHAAVTLGVFGKVTDDIYTKVTPTVTSVLSYTTAVPSRAHLARYRLHSPGASAPANGAKETYKGIELTWQHFLEMGLGAHFQVTHTWSRGYDQDATRQVRSIRLRPPRCRPASLLKRAPSVPM